jgi:cytoskeleton protein RodZ
MPEIGATLREARMRARIDVSEIEAQTKIRAKYLRALENEEWSLLPGPTFVKSFLRTYAQALGLDGKALVEEYRLAHERPSDAMLEPIISTPQRNRSRGRTGPNSGPSPGYMLAVGGIGVLIVLLIVLLISGGKGGSSSPKSTPTHNAVAITHKRAHTVKHTSSRHSSVAPGSSSSLVSVSLKASSTVYVCLVDESGHKLIPGVNLQAGESTRVYHSKRFEITLGNNSVMLYVDGTPRPVPASSQAIGYEITKAHGRQPLSAAQLPTCA